MKMRNFLPPPPARLLWALLVGLLVTTVSCGDDETDGPDRPGAPKVTVTLGAVGENSIELQLLGENADEMAYMCVKEADDTGKPEAITIFSEGTTVLVAEEAVPQRIMPLDPETRYVIYAAARKQDTYGAVKTVRATTTSHEQILSFISSSKTDFTYQIVMPDGATCYHTYFEGWFFEYELSMAMEVEGEKFDMSVFLWNLLADYGYEETYSRQITWRAGAENSLRNHVALLVPGKKYYAVASLFDTENTMWSGVPEAIDFEMAPGGTSSATIEATVTEITSERAVVRMECPEDVCFYYYNLFEKTQYDAFKAEKGERGMMDYISEYGYPATNTYTDTWGVDPGKSYMLGIYGVDRNGDEFFSELETAAPELIPELYVEMMPYDRELQGYHDYDSFLLNVAPMNFPDLDPSQIVCMAAPMDRATFDSYLDAFGLGGSSLEDLEADPMTLYYMFNGSILFPLYNDAEIESIETKGYFERIVTDLTPDTEYVYIAMALNGEQFVCNIATARTAASPVTGTVDEAYKSYLGTWTVLGQTTENWTDYVTYTLRIEELTPNRSYKVYGWSHSDVSQRYPFVMRYHPETGKISVDGMQTLGQMELDGGGVADIVFVGMIAANGQLALLTGYTGTYYTGRVTDDHFAMFGEMLQVNNRWYSFQTMTYLVYDGEEFHVLEGDEYEIVNFTIDRPSAAAAEAAVRTPGAARAMRVGAVCPTVERTFEPLPAARRIAPSADAGVRIGGELAVRYAENPAQLSSLQRSLPLLGARRIAKQ